MILLAFGWNKEMALLQADLEDDDNHDIDMKIMTKINMINMKIKIKKRLI